MICRAKDDVLQAISIDVAGSGDGSAGEVTWCGASDPESACPTRNVVQVNRLLITGLTENDIGCSCISAGGQAVGGAQYDVIDSVTVDIAGGGDPAASECAGIVAGDSVAAGSCSNFAQIDILNTGS